MNLVTCSILSNLSPNMFTGHGEAVFCITVISLILTTCINSSSLTDICMYLMLKIMLLCITNYNSIMPLVSWETSLLLQTPPSAVASLQTHSDTPRRSPPHFPSTSSRQCPARWVWWWWCSWAGWLRGCNPLTVSLVSELLVLIGPMGDFLNSTLSSSVTALKLKQSNIEPHQVSW